MEYQGANQFVHSVKLPRIYKDAAKICRKIENGEAGIKKLVFDKKFGNVKGLHALVTNVFAQAASIDLLLKRTNLLEKEPRLDPWCARVLITELIWGKKTLPDVPAKPILTIRAYEPAFKSHLSDCRINDTKDSSTIKFPRYVRINTLITSFNEAQHLFEEDGWILKCMPNGDKDYSNFIEQVANLEGDYFMKDLHVPNLLIFPSGTDFHLHPGYKKGIIALQNKASSIPVQILSPPPGSIVLDMCAAPGMKTTQLATVLNDEGIIYAVEKNVERYETLNKMVAQSGATCIKTINKDVLDCNAEDFPDVEYVLLDPSCSNSGALDQLHISQKKDTARLEKLAGFQIKILRSALTRYPKVKKIVYSTCSLYPGENEDVVRQVLETNDQFKLVPANKYLNAEWKNFGSPNFGDIGRFCLYARPEDDLTIGFFVAVFERLEEGEYNQFFNGRIRRFTKKLDRREQKKNEFNNRIESVETQNTENRAILHHISEKLETNRILTDCNEVDEASLTTNKGERHLLNDVPDITVEQTMDEVVKDIQCPPLADQKIQKKRHKETENVSIHSKAIEMSKTDKKQAKKCEFQNVETMLDNASYNSANIQEDTETEECNKKSNKRKRKSSMNSTELQLVEELLNKYIPKDNVCEKSKRKKKMNDK